MISETIFQYLLIAWISIAVLIFPLLLKITVPYGRHTSSKWGFTISNKFGWILMEIPVVIVFTYFFFSGSVEKSIAVYVFYLLFMIHYFNRIFIFPFRIKTKGKRIPLLIVIFGILFNIINGFFNGYWFGYLSPVYDISYLSDPKFIIGITLFFTGMIININSDNKLLSLRKGGKKGYFIPKGRLFNFISSPNLFGEIVEWSGWAIMCWCLPALSFAIWTFANLVPRALDHHQWYKGKFDDYPKNRKAVFPFLL
jgi:hypothetical protein